MTVIHLPLTGSGFIVPYLIIVSYIPHFFIKQTEEGHTYAQLALERSVHVECCNSLLLEHSNVASFPGPQE